jgi:hypothetical protein
MLNARPLSTEYDLNFIAGYTDALCASEEIDQHVSTEYALPQRLLLYFCSALLHYGIRMHHYSTATNPTHFSASSLFIRR